MSPDKLPFFQLLRLPWAGRNPWWIIALVAPVFYWQPSAAICVVCMVLCAPMAPATRPVASGMQLQTCAKYTQLSPCSSDSFLGSLLHVAQICHHLAVFQVRRTVAWAKCRSVQSALQADFYQPADCRLAALLGGVDPPENMQRCFANNCDLEVRFAEWSVLA